MPNGGTYGSIGGAGSTAMDIEPGMWIGLQEELMQLEWRIAELQASLDRETNAIARAELEAQILQAQEQLAQRRLETELQLATSPIDFVAYELYKREMQEQGGAQAAAWEEEQSRYEGDVAYQRQRYDAARAGIEAEYAGRTHHPGYGEALRALNEEFQHIFAQQEAWRNPEQEGYGPAGVVHTDEEIRAMLAEMTGVAQGRMIGEFGAAVPTTQQFSREARLKMSPDEMAVLASFLRAGVTTPGTEATTTIDPVEYFREMEEGFVPYMRDVGPTRYGF